MDLINTLTVFVIPSVAFLLPFLILTFHIIRNDLQLILARSQILKYTAVTFLLTVLIFLLLSYLTSDFLWVYSTTPGLFVFEGGVQLNIGTHLSLSFRYDPGISLLVVSFLSAILYSSLLVLPPVCTYEAKQFVEAQEQEVSDGSGKGAGSSVTGSMTAAVSAVASSALCCSTSIAAVFAPAILTLLGPFAPFLIYLSMAVLVYSFVSIVMPRFPTMEELQ